MRGSPLTRSTRSLTATGLVMVMAGGLLAGCYGAASRSCADQEGLAASLATDEIFTKVTLAARSLDSYTTTPCEEGSGGSTVVAGHRYAVEQPLTFDGLRALADRAVDPTRWTAVGQFRPQDPGSGGSAVICYRFAAGREHRYLKFRATADRDATGGAPGELTLLYVEVAQADEELVICAGPG